MFQPPANLPVRSYFGRLHSSSADRASHALRPFTHMLALHAAEVEGALAPYAQEDQARRASGRAWACLPSPAPCHVELHTHLTVLHTTGDTAGGLLVNWCSCRRRHLTHHAPAINLLLPGTPAQPNGLLHY